MFVNANSKLLMLLVINDVYRSAKKNSVIGRLLSLTSAVLHTDCQLLINDLPTQTTGEHELTSTGARTTNLLRIPHFCSAVQTPTQGGYAPG